MKSTGAAFGSVEPHRVGNGAVPQATSGSSFLSNLRRSLQEDGLYVLAVRRLAMACGTLRNHLLAQKFGVKKINIGAHANLRGLQHIEMGEDFVAQDGLWLHAVTRYGDQQFSPRILIGDRVRISQWVHIAATHHVEIGDDVLMGSKVIITDHNHGQYSGGHSSPLIAPALRRLDDDRRVVIGNKVWLGDGVVVAPGATIGEGAVVGANSVVVSNIPAFSLAVGVPARVIKVFDFNLQEWVRVGESP